MLKTRDFLITLLLQLASHPLVKQPKNLNYQSFFLHLKNPLVDTFSERSEISSAKSVSGKGMNIPDLPKKLQFFWYRSSVFALAK